MTGIETLQAFWAARELFWDAIVAATAAGSALGILGVYVVLRRMVFLSAALSQAAGFGVTMGFALQAAVGAGAGLLGEACVATGAVGMTLLATALVARQAAWSDAPQDGLLGAIYLVGSAGSLVVATRIVQELHDVQSLLLGSAVAVLPHQARLIVMMSGCLVAVHLWWQRGMVEALFDPDGARVRQLPVRFLQGSLMVSLAVAISVCTRILGALPVFAFSVLPALAALACVRNVAQALVVACLVGGASGCLGYLLAYVYGCPVGASQTLVAAGFAFVGTLAGRKKARAGRTS